jgi:hypothetical protein
MKRSKLLVVVLMHLFEDICPPKNEKSLNDYTRRLKALKGAIFGTFLMFALYF